MTLIQLGIVVLVLAAVAIYFAPKLVEWRERIKDRVKPVVCVPPPTDATEGRVRRMLLLIDLIKQLDEVGAKSAAGKLKGAASLLVDEDFLK